MGRIQTYCKWLLLCCLAATCLPLTFAVDGDLVICAGAKVYPSPTADPIENAVLFIRDGKLKLVAEGNRLKIPFPASAKQLDCRGKFIVAGFWNSHVHFETGWDDADKQPAGQLESHMQEMLTKWGVTTVWDLGSVPTNTMTIRKRVESGEVPGPQILMAGDIFPKGGHPAYLPPEMQLPEAATPEDALRMARGYFFMGLDGIKLFTGSYMGPGKPVVNMDTSLVAVVGELTHAMHRPLFAHPQNRIGTDNALNGGVDILAHTIPTEGSFTSAELEQMKRQHTALIPTLTLWTTVVSDKKIQEQLVQAGVDETKAFLANGGMVLFGTDGGFQTVYDTTLEYEYMGRAMGWKDILASLTTNPAIQFSTATKGQVEKDMDADLVALDADPAVDVKNFAKVAWTMRKGKVIYEKK